MFTKTQLLALLGALSIASAQSKISFGPYYSLGAVQGTYIAESDTTLYPGKTPSPQQNRMVLWPGMGTDAIPGTSNGALVQAIVSSSGSEAAGLCGAKSGQWCVFASTLNGVEGQVSGKAVPMDASSGVNVHYKYNTTTQKYDQTVSVDGKVVSTLSTLSGKGIGWGTAVECQDQCSGVVNAHSKSKAQTKPRGVRAGSANMNWNTSTRL